MKRATVVPSEDGKSFRVLLGEREIGVSKTDFDARFHMHAINDALDVAFLEGEKYLERMVEKARLDIELHDLYMAAKIEQRLIYECCKPEDEVGGEARAADGSTALQEYHSTYRRGWGNDAPNPTEDHGQPPAAGGILLADEWLKVATVPSEARVGAGKNLLVHLRKVFNLLIQRLTRR